MREINSEVKLSLCCYIFVQYGSSVFDEHGIRILWMRCGMSVHMDVMPNMHVWLIFLLRHGNKEVMVPCKNNIPCVMDWLKS